MGWKDAWLHQKYSHSHYKLMFHHFAYPLFFCNNWAKRLVMNSDVSMNRSTQLVRHVSVLLSNLLEGVSMHLSQQISLNSWICANQRSRTN